MQDALLDPVRSQDVTGKLVPIRGQREQAGYSRSVQNERPGWQPRHCHILEVVKKERLEALIGWMQVAGEQPFFFTILIDKTRKNVEQSRPHFRGWRRDSQQRQFHLDVIFQRGARRIGLAPRLSQASIPVADRIHRYWSKTAHPELATPFS